MAVRYQTAEQLAETIGGISARTVRSLRFQGLPAVKLGKAFLYDPEKALAWVAAREEAQCPVPTAAPGSNTLPAALLSCIKAPCPLRHPRWNDVQSVGQSKRAMA